MEPATKLYKQQKKYKLVYALFVDFLYLIKIKKNIILLKYCTEVTQKELTVVYNALSVIEVKWDRYFYYIIVSDVKTDSAVSLTEFVDDFVEFVFFYYEFVKGTDVLNYITIYKSNPMLFVNTITLLSKGLPVKTPSSWGYLLKNETHTIGGALVVDTITFKDVEFLVKYFS
jgi:hypothetical protein